MTGTIKVKGRSIRAEDITEEEVTAMTDEEIMAVDPEVVEEGAPEGGEAVAVEEVVAVVDQRQQLVDERASLEQRLADIDGMIAEMDAAVVPLIDEAVNEPAVTEGEPEPVISADMTEEEEIVARRKALRRIAKRNAADRRRAA